MAHRKGWEFWEEPALQKNMKVKARIHFRRMFEISGQERSWKEIHVHKCGDVRFEMRIKCLNARIRENNW